MPAKRATGNARPARSPARTRTETEPLVSVGAHAAACMAHTEAFGYLASGQVRSLGDAPEALDEARLSEAEKKQLWQEVELRASMIQMMASMGQAAIAAGMPPPSPPIHLVAAGMPDPVVAAKAVAAAAARATTPQENKIELAAACARIQGEQAFVDKLIRAGVCKPVSFWESCLTLCADRGTQR